MEKDAQVVVRLPAAVLVEVVEAAGRRGVSEWVREAIAGRLRADRAWLDMERVVGEERAKVERVAADLEARRLQRIENMRRNAK